ncbi:unnamed protein product [Onchocerca flexuosa]|uniref:IBB domain-containing protein n=1 Tax=Onchocerca flexuosa TaxID=387005 RepID=A0A183H3J9_9BILA|nr:unnamed protein product [Onchocerca flexuosa]
MPRRRSNLCRHTRTTETQRRFIANQTEEERASANERKRQRMAQMRAGDLRIAGLREHRSCSVTSDLLNSEQNQRDRLKVAERR